LEPVNGGGLIDDAKLATKNLLTDSGFWIVSHIGIFGHILIPKLDM